MKVFSPAAVAILTMAAPLPALAQQPSPAAASKGENTMQRADDDMRKVLEAHQSLGPKPIAQLTPKQARKQPTPADAVKAVMKEEGKAPPPAAAQKRNMTYAAADGGEQPIRIYTPQKAQPGQPLPVIVYYHGGGWVIATIDTYDASAMALAEKANAIVASAEYRHAPEAKFPAAHQDAFAAYQWVLKNAGKFGGDPQRVAVAGESAGGNLAANVAIMARDKKVQAPLHMLLVYPVAGSNMSTASYKENADARPLDKPTMAWFVQHALEPKDKQSPMINLVAANLKGLPPATIITAEIDPLRSEGEQLAKKLEAAGVETTYRNFDGVTHEFFGMAAVVADAAQAQTLAARELRESFDGAGEKMRTAADD